MIGVHTLTQPSTQHPPNTPQLRFGWTADNPPPPVRFDPEQDLASKRRLECTDEFVAKCAEMLVRTTPEDLEHPGVVIIPPEDVAQLGNEKNIEDFQHNLIEQIGYYFEQHIPQMLSYLSPIGINRRINDSKDFQVVSISDNPFQRHSKDKQQSARGFLHWDYWNWPLLGFHYQPFVNISGGIPRLFDCKQLARDLNKTMSELTVMTPKGFATLKPEYLNDLDMQAKYSIPIPIGAIILINNKLDAGVAHGPTDAQRISNREPVRKPLFHTAIKLRTKR